MPGDDARSYQIDSVDRALRVILAFQDVGELSINQAAEMLDVSRSTAYRLLTVLEHRDFVRQDPKSKLFHSGPALLRSGLLAVQRSDVRAMMRPALESVVAQVDETAHLVVLDHGDAFFIDCVEGSRSVRATPRVGMSLPAHVTAGGMALMANLPQTALDAILAEKLPSVTARSRTSVRSIRAELERVRKRGWAFNDGQSEVGLRAVAARFEEPGLSSVLDVAITVAGPTERLSDDRIEDIAGVLLAHPASRRSSS